MKSTFVLFLSVIVAILVVAGAFFFLKPEEEVTLPLQVKEYFDFQCIHCKDFHPVSVQLREKYADNPDVEFVYVNLPILGPASEQAAFAAEAAGEQGKEREYIDLLFENFESRTDEDLVKFAEDLELDIDKFNADRESEEIQNRVLDGVEEARAKNITSTPTVTVNDRKVSENSFDKIVETVDEKLELAKEQDEK